MMILNALYRLHGRLESDPAYGIAPPGFSDQKVAFIVVLEPDGKLYAIQDARIPVKRGRTTTRRVRVPGTNKPSGSGLNPCFLWDNQTYLLGFDPGKPKRAQKAFQAFRDRHLPLKDEIGVPEFSAVCRFLERWDPVNAAGYKILDEVGTGFGVFQIRGQDRFVHDHPKIIAWWKRQKPKGNGAPQGQCLVTGKRGPIARIHPKIKGVAGTQSAGATIAGFNDSAYWSYGFEQSFNAPVSEEATLKYTAALNALLEGPRRDKHRLVVGGATIVFWTEKPTPTEDIFLPFVAHGSATIEDERPQDETIRSKLEAFLKALRRGREAYAELEDKPDATTYYILGLAPNAARIVVRFFHKGSLFQLLENLRRHFADIEIQRRFWDGSKHPLPELPSLWLLLRQTARESKDIPPVLPAPLLAAIVTGTRYPTALFQTAMRRISADRIVNYPRACIIKGYLIRNLGKEVPVSLDTSRIDPAYRLGRLFAALEKTQQDALGSAIKATIRDNFYSSASATPASVFPRLLRTYQHHLSKLEGGHRINREKLVQEILDPIGEFPAHLSLADQGLFAIGYYHQTNDFYRSKKDRDATSKA